MKGFQTEHQPLGNITARGVIWREMFSMADNAIQHDGLVAKVIDSQKVVLNKGAQDGISEGDRFVVFSLGEEVHDPKTGESLGMLEEVKGKGKVVHVQDCVCTIETYEFDMMPASPSIFATVSEKMYGRKEPLYRKFVDVQRGDYARRL